MSDGDERIRTARSIISEAEDAYSAAPDETGWDALKLSLTAGITAAFLHRDAEIERLTERCEAYKGQVKAGAVEIERLQKHSAERAQDIITLGQEVGRLRGALQWYADDDSWQDCGDAESYSSKAKDDAGQRAKVALNQQQPRDEKKSAEQ